MVRQEQCVALWMQLFDETWLAFCCELVIQTRPILCRREGKLSKRASGNHPKGHADKGAKIPKRPLQHAAPVYVKRNLVASHLVGHGVHVGLASTCRSTNNASCFLKIAPPFYSSENSLDRFGPPPRFSAQTKSTYVTYVCN